MCTPTWLLTSLLVIDASLRKWTADISTNPQVTSTPVKQVVWWSSGGSFLSSFHSFLLFVCSRSPSFCVFTLPFLCFLSWTDITELMCFFPSSLWGRTGRSPVLSNCTTDTKYGGHRPLSAPTHNSHRQAGKKKKINPGADRISSASQDGGHAHTLPPHRMTCCVV